VCDGILWDKILWTICLGLALNYNPSVVFLPE
jgi:hypothetical protein